jgi:hypothetical protein
MALGSNKKQASNSIFVDLKFKAGGSGEGVGFRQTLSKTPTGAPAGEKQFTYEYATHNFVEGHLIGFADVDGGPNVVVKFPLAQSAGRRMVGLLNAVKGGGPMIHLYTNHADIGTVIGDKTLTKPQAYLNLRAGGPKGEKIDAIYADADGNSMLQENGAPAQLAMGVPVVVNKKSIWDFAAADDMAFNTALALTEHFTKQADGHDDKPAEDGINPHEAADAAGAMAPHG